MREEPQKRSSLPLAVTWIATPFFVLSLYFLSSGPAIMLMKYGYLSGGNFRRVYRPIGWACGLAPWLNDLIQWYSRLWGA